MEFRIDEAKDGCEQNDVFKNAQRKVLEALNVTWSLEPQEAMCSRSEFINTLSTPSELYFLLTLHVHSFISKM